MPLISKQAQLLIGDREDLSLKARNENNVSKLAYVLYGIMLVTNSLYITRLYSNTLIPLSLNTITPFLFLIYLLWKRKCKIIDILKSTELVLFGVLIIYIAVMSCLIDGLTFETIKAIVRLSAALVMCGTIYLFCLNEREHVLYTYRILVVVATISCLWYLAELFYFSVAAGYRLQLYSSFYSAKELIFVRSFKTGLAPYPHLVGYQIIPMLFIALMFYLGKRKILGGGLLILFIVVLYYLGQRSVLMSIMAGTIILLVLDKTNKVKLAQFLTFVVIMGSITYVVRDMLGGYNYSHLENIFGKIIGSERIDIPILDRLNVQLFAVKLIIENPLGLELAGIQWSDINFKYLIAVHNSYLAVGIAVGILASIICACLLTAIGFKVVKLVKVKDQKGVLSIEKLSASIIVGLLFAQAMFHNAGLASQEPISVVMLGVFCTVNPERVAGDVNDNI